MYDRRQSRTASGKGQLRPTFEKVEPEMRGQTKNDRLLFLSLLSAASAYTADISIFPIVLASLARDFDIGSGDGVLAYSYNIALVCGIVPAYYSRTPRALWSIFRFGLLLFAAGSIALLVSNSYQGVLSARILMGLGAGIFSPLIPSVISVTFAEKTRYLSYWATTTGVVCVVAPLMLILAAQVLAVKSSVATVVVLSVMGLWFSRYPTIVASRADELIESDRRSEVSWKGLTSVLITVFVLYGQVTWLMYSVPLRSARAGASDVYLALLGASPWLSFTAVCYAMTLVSSVHFSRCLGLSAILAAAGLILAASGSAGYPLGAFLIMVLAGAAMGTANIPSTVLAFSYADPSRYGLISCLDILAARLGGAFYLFWYDWLSPGDGIAWSGLPLVILLVYVSASQRNLNRDGILR